VEPLFLFRPNQPLNLLDNFDKYVLEKAPIVGAFLFLSVNVVNFTSYIYLWSVTVWLETSHNLIVDGDIFRKTIPGAINLRPYGSAALAAELYDRFVDL
jgi:hypothetical protein